MKDYLYNLATDKQGGFIATVLKCFLLILSWSYGIVVRFLIWFYRIKRHRLGCKVISVGNITLGGTGKTPLVEFIAKYLRAQGHKVAILSRGYKRRKTEIPSYELRLPQTVAGPPHMAAEVTSYEKIGDEPYMIREKLGDMPVLVDHNRIRSANSAIRDYGVDTVVLDDGFQQWKIKKGLEIVTINAANPFGNRHMLPRGILREPLVSLKRADIFVLTKIDLCADCKPLKGYLSRINPSSLIIETVYKPLGFCGITDPRGEMIKPDSLREQQVSLVCGIADPDSFEALIKNLDLKVGLVFKFPDHHCYTKEELIRIIQASNNKNIRTIITTEKDSVRFPAMDYESIPMKFLTLVIEIKFKDNEEEFRNRLLGIYRR